MSVEDVRPAPLLMDSLPSNEREKACWAFAAVSTLRGKGGYSEEEIAAKAGFGSVEHMRHQLRAWEAPDWLISEEPAAKKRKLGAGSGAAKRVPPPGDASVLFREELEALLCSAGDLEHRKEEYHDGRFSGADVYQDPILWPREAVASEEEWLELCNKFGQDPGSNSVWLTDATLSSPAGASPAPPEPLTTLIGVYALSGGDMDSLFEALYPGTPPDEVKEAVRKRVEGRKKSPDKMDGIRAVAEQIAKLIRGGNIKGAPKTGLSTTEQDAACFITQLREEGKSDEAIRQHLRNHKKADGSEFTIQDVVEFGSLRLRYLSL